jgi:hypothetical protein
MREMEMEMNSGAGGEIEMGAMGIGPSAGQYGGYEYAQEGLGHGQPYQHQHHHGFDENVSGFNFGAGVESGAYELSYDHTNPHATSNSSHAMHLSLPNTDASTHGLDVAGYPAPSSSHVPYSGDASSSSYHHAQPSTSASDPFGLLHTSIPDGSAYTNTNMSVASHQHPQLELQQQNNSPYGSSATDFFGPVTNPHPHPDSNAQYGMFGGSGSGGFDVHSLGALSDVDMGVFSGTSVVNSSFTDQQHHAQQRFGNASSGSPYGNEHGTGTNTSGPSSASTSASIIIPTYGYASPNLPSNAHSNSHSAAPFGAVEAGTASNRLVTGYGKCLGSNSAMGKGKAPASVPQSLVGYRSKSRWDVDVLPVPDRTVL